MGKAGPDSRFPVLEDGARSAPPPPTRGSRPDAPTRTPLPSTAQSGARRASLPCRSRVTQPALLAVQGKADAGHGRSCTRTGDLGAWPRATGTGVAEACPPSRHLALPGFCATRSTKKWATFSPPLRREAEKKMTLNPWLDRA